MKIPFSPKIRRRILAALAVIVLAGVFFDQVAPRLMKDPMATLERQTPVRAHRDASGEIVWLERTYEGQWRMPVPLSQVSPDFLEAILIAEDRDFFRHHGISWNAVLRAFFSNVQKGRIVSGASTITMQLVALPNEGRRKNFIMKIHQMLQARRLEMLYSKERILTEYVNRVPFGGKIYGIEAASRFYFDKPASALRKHEAIMLSGLPRKPNAYRPNRHPKRAKSRMLQILVKLERNGKITQEEMKALYEMPLAYRRFDRPSQMQKLAHPYRDLHYLAMAARTPGYTRDSNRRIYLNPLVQNNTLLALKDAYRQVGASGDAAAVILDSRTSRVIAYIGTLDYLNPVNGQVDAAKARRSAGSTLKPLIYAEAIDAGRLNTATILEDTPLRIGSYTPLNFDGSFMGRVSAEEALSRSLNIPALRLLMMLGTERMKERFNSIGLWTHAPTTHVQWGLPMALGTAGHSLLNITAAYTAFANNGIYTPPCFSEADIPRPRRLLSPGAAQMTSLMLRHLPMPECSLPVAWKTGTSNGLCDAWCIAYTPDYTVGVWFGNKNGWSATYLVGARIAAPAAGRIMTSLYSGNAGRKLQWPDERQFLNHEQLCAETGLAPSHECKKLTYGWVHKQYPPDTCRRCAAPPVKRIQITSPRKQLYLTPTSHGIPLLVTSDYPETEWYIDYRYVGRIPPGQTHLFPCGQHTISALSADGKAESATFTFNVQMEP